VNLTQSFSLETQLTSGHASSVDVAIPLELQLPADLYAAHASLIGGTWTGTPSVRVSAQYEDRVTCVIGGTSSANFRLHVLLIPRSSQLPVVQPVARPLANTPLEAGAPEANEQVLLLRPAPSGFFSALRRNLSDFMGSVWRRASITPTIPGDAAGEAGMMAMTRDANGTRIFFRDSTGWVMVQAQATQWNIRDLGIRQIIDMPIPNGASQVTVTFPEAFATGHQPYVFPTVMSVASEPLLFANPAQATATQVVVRLSGTTTTGNYRLRLVAEDPVA
jgi:hypothetical protein